MEHFEIINEFKFEFFIVVELKKRPETEHLGVFPAFLKGLNSIEYLKLHYIFPWTELLRNWKGSLGNLL